ncbi:MAG TPA: serine/threonine-protein kinase, partial [Polyangiaceae bacterium]
MERTLNCMDGMPNHEGFWIPKAPNFHHPRVMAQKPPTDLTGQVIAGRYELLEVIARGGQGLVWRAKDQREGGEVAVKTLDEAAARDPQLVERFRREQRALVALEGTSAVRVFDMAPASNGALCLVMELLDGTDLESHLEELEARSERMMTERLFEILAPVVDTLEKAHAAGIFHRDLKPANIFLLKGGGVRLLDFGFARIRAARALTAVGTVMGSPAYIAPEVWKGRPDRIDHRVDIYSLAVVIFRVLAGRPPFETESLPEMLKLATSATRPSLLTFRPALPPDIDAWVKQALAVEPDERFRSVRALWNSLHDILLPGQPLTSSEPEPRPEPKPARARPRGLAAALRKAADKAADVVRRLAGSEEAPTDQSGATSGEPSAEPAAKPKTDLATPSSAHEETTSS